MVFPACFYLNRIGDIPKPEPDICPKTISFGILRPGATVFVIYLYLALVALNTLKASSLSREGIKAA